MTLLAPLALSFAADAGAAKNRAPTVSITSPATGASYSVPATIAIMTNAADADGSVVRVDFYQGTTLLGTRTAPPYSYTWSGVPAGSYSLNAKATDDAGATATSATVTVTVTAPKIAIAQPAAGSVVYGTQTVVSGTFSGEAGSTIVVDGPFGSQLAKINGSSYSATVPIVVGANTLRATVARRNRTFDTVSIVVTGNLYPLLTFVSPAAAAFDAPALVSLVVDAMSPAGTIARVDFFRGTTLIGSSSTPPFALNWTNPPIGSHMVSATAVDDQGYAATASLPIVVNGTNAPPTVQLTAPSPGTVFTSPATIALAATASDSDGTIAKLDFLRDSTVIGTTNVAPYAMTWSGVAAGTYALTARATDDRGAVATSAPVSVTIRPPNAPPSVALTAPADGATYTGPASVALAATASDSDGTVVRVDFLVGSTVVASTTNAPFAATWSNVAAGSYALTARATDSSGATAVSGPRSITVVANAPPTVMLTQPVAGSTYYAPGSVTLVATAADADGSVAVVEFYAGTTSIGTATAPPFTVRWDNVVAGNYALTARAVDNGGAASVSPPVSITIKPPALGIDSPVAGSVVAAGQVHVWGSVQAPDDVGIVVNGVVAAIDGSRFYAANVPLVPGINTLTATLTRRDGTSSSQSLDITSAPAAVAIVVSPADGFAPLTTTIAASASDGTEIAKIEIDGDGNGRFDGTITSAPWETSITYLSPATVTLMIRVTDTAGNVYTEAVPIVVLERSAVDQRVRAVWTGMTIALAAGDTATALTYLDSLARQRYGPVFSMLQPNFGAIVPTFSNPQGVSLTHEFGEYAVNRVIDGQNRLFFIYFGRNGDGVWRIGSM
jgi:hypothetical protein